MASDHVLDAVLCCLTVVAARAGTTAGPVGADQVEAARVEGWIHVPTAPLDVLAPPDLPELQH